MSKQRNNCVGYQNSHEESTRGVFGGMQTIGSKCLNNQTLKDCKPISALKSEIQNTKMLHMDVKHFG